MGAKPLDGIRVLDFGQVVAGPILGHLLADFGAEVIRVESAAGTDVMRTITPVRTPIREFLESTYHYRNRTCISLNLNKPEGVRLAKDIVKRCDVLIENYSPKVFRRFGMDYESLTKINPGLVMISMTASGQSGPLSGIIAYGPSINAVAGTDSMVGYQEDGSLAVNTWDADYVMGVTGAMAVITALHHKANTGEGQYIDMAYFEALAALLGEAVMDYSMNGRVARPQGNRHPTMAPHGIYPCAGEDRWISIAVQTEEEWKALRKVMGSPAWSEEADFVDLYARLQHRDELDKLLGQWTAKFDSYDLMERLQKAGVAAVPVMTLADVYLDPHDKFRRSSTRIEIEGVDPQDIVYGIPWKLSDTPGSIYRLAPKMGQDNQKFFHDVMGLPKPEIERLIKDQVIY